MDNKLIKEAIAHIQSDRKERAIEILEGMQKLPQTEAFTLTVLPNGKAILSTERVMPPEEAQQIMQAFLSWREKANDIMILGSTRVLTVLDIKLDLPQGQKA